MANRIRDNISLAYGNASYGFGLDDYGNLLVVICTISSRTNKVIILDEFSVDVNFLNYGRNELLKLLSEQINDELYRIHLQKLYI